MKKSFLFYGIPLGIFISLCIITCSKQSTLVSGTSHLQVEPNVPAILAYLESEDYQTNWNHYPGIDTNLRRLAMPVHGRWVKTYVNDIAYDFLLKAQKGEVKEPFEFPEGSCIVKDNYRSQPQATSITPNASVLKVLTFLFKPAASFNYCATPPDANYNGEDCYGGGWFYGFHMINGLPKLDSGVQMHRSSFCITCHAPSFNTDYVRTLNGQLHPFSQPSTKAYCDAFLEEKNSLNNAGISNPLTPKQIKELKSGLKAYVSMGKLSPELPSDVPFNPSDVFTYIGPEQTQEMFDSYAWKTFISLNWPNKTATASGVPQRGEPDPALPFTGPRERPTVWETYKPTFEVFRPYDDTWNPVDQVWNSPQVKLKGNDCDCDEGEFVLSMQSKNRSVANETGQAFAGSFGYLVDRNRKKVRYEVLFNETEFDYLIADGKAATANLTPSGPKGVQANFPDTKDDPRNVGSMEIKSAWKELCFGDDCEYQVAANLEEAMEKFYVRNVVIYNEDSGTCRKANAALVGLHVTRKTHFAPQWIWMTFEHKDNVPEFGRTDQQATFFNPELAETTDCWNFPFLDTTAGVVTCPNVDINRFYSDWADEPNQLTRLVKIQKQAADQNNLFAKQMKKEGGSPFENYILVDTQWPLNGRNKDGNVSKINCADNELGEDCFKMVPRFLRNTVIESFMSTYCTDDGENKQSSNRSCMSCHGTAGADFSYIWLDAVSQRVKVE